MSYTGISSRFDLGVSMDDAISVGGYVCPIDPANGTICEACE